MRNTINLYCLANKIDVDTLTEYLGIDRTETLKILKEETIVPNELVQKLCILFHCEPKDLIL
jgi:DNA-binding Xre family transcriptional regulator